MLSGLLKEEIITPLGLKVSRVVGYRLIPNKKNAGTQNFVSLHFEE
jgi:hypothetical protein